MRLRVAAAGRAPGPAVAARAMAAALAAPPVIGAHPRWRAGTTEPSRLALRLDADVAAPLLVAEERDNGGDEAGPGECDTSEGSRGRGEPWLEGEEVALPGGSWQLELYDLTCWCGGQAEKPGGREGEEIATNG